MKNLVEQVVPTNLDEFIKVLDNDISHKSKHSVVTANPEIFINSQQDPKIEAFLFEPSTYIVADGVGITFAYRKYFKQKIARVTGVDIVARLLTSGNEKSYRLFVYGAKQSVLDKFATQLQSNYPNVEVVQMLNGYDHSFDEVIDIMKTTSFDICFVALGVPRQEQFMQEAISVIEQGIMVGCGGAIDVLSGNVQRAPQIMVSLNLEWLYRITKEPKRFKRFWHNQMKFIKLVLFKNEKRNIE